MIVRIIQHFKRKYERYENQKKAYDYQETSGGWRKYKCNPVLGNENTGSMFDPFVRLVDGEYFMCVSKRKNHTLMMYTSLDGITWENECEILRGKQGSSWETSVNRGCFAIKDKKWYLWYTGQHNGNSRIGLAVSEDGKKYNRLSENPILIPELEHEGDAVMNPCVIWDKERQRFRMWYAAGENYEPDVICYAESIDGILWTKYPHPILTSDVSNAYQKFKVGACDVVKVSSEQFLMAYIAYQNIDVARICLAYSKDGITNWQPIVENPVIAPGQNKWDGHSVYKPSLCINQERHCAMLWYNGRFKKNEFIGMAFYEEKI